MENKTRILLTGASGTVGLEVLRQLCHLKKDCDLTIFDIKTKKTVKAFSPYRKKLNIIWGDISINDDIKMACVQQDFVIHLAAIIPPLADQNPDLAFQVNTIGTENLIRNLEYFSPHAFFLYSSSISVYGDRLTNPTIRVGDPLLASEGDEYAKTKIKAEEIIRNCQLDWSIFRLTAIMGNHKLSPLLFHMPLSTPMEIASPEDTASAFIQAIEKKGFLSKRIFNLGGGESCRITYEEFLTQSFQIFGLGKLNFPQKAFAEKNFHCGFYEDGNALEEILHFRKDSIHSYFQKVKQNTPQWRKILASFVKKPIKSYLLKKSDPYQAFLSDNVLMKKRYFNIY